jgi:hypothetical protein
MKLPANIGSTPRAEFLLSPWPQGRFDWCCPAKIVRHSTWNPGICCSCWEAFCWHSPSMRALCARPAAPKASRSRYPPAPVSRCRTVDCCCIKPPRRHNSPGWIRTARKFPQAVIPVTCRRLISRQTGGTRWSPCSHCQSIHFWQRRRSLSRVVSRQPASGFRFHARRQPRRHLR